jgi:transposase
LAHAPRAAISRRKASLSRYRNLVERFFSKLKHFRAVAIHFEKHSEKRPRSRQTRLSQNLNALYESVS